MNTIQILEQFEAAKVKLNELFCKGHLSYAQVRLLEAELFKQLQAQLTA